MQEPLIVSDKIAQLFAENPDEYQDPTKFLSILRQRIGNPDYFTAAKCLQSDGKNAESGELVRFRGMIQNSHNAEFMRAKCAILLPDGTRVTTTSMFADLFSIKECQDFGDLTPDISVMLYNVCPIPGETNLVSQKFLGSSNDQNPNESGHSQMSNELLTIRVYDQEDEFPTNSIIEFYGVFYPPPNGISFGENSLSTPMQAVYGNPNVHLIDYRLITYFELCPRPLSPFAQPFEHLCQLFGVLMGSELGARYLLNALVAKTVKWTETVYTPYCSMPVAFMNVQDSASIIDTVRLLMPMVQVIPITKQLLEGEQLFPVMDHGTGRLEGGRLQLARGSVLILDFTKYAQRAVIANRDTKTMKNLEALQCLIDYQKIMMDFSVNFHRLEADVRIIALVPPGRSFDVPHLRFPAVVPLKVVYTDGINPAGELSKVDSNVLDTFRWYLASVRERLERVELTHEIQQAIVGQFTEIRQRVKVDVPNHFNHLISLSRIQTALYGQSQIQLDTFEKIKDSEYARLTLMGLLAIRS